MLSRQTLTGKVFGHLEVIEEVETRSNNRRYFKVLCDCGNTKEMYITDIKKASRCGQCNSHIRYPKEYTAWKNMKQRCNNKNHPDYKDYGGRGIVVSKELENNFFLFLAEVGEAPSPEYSLEREDNMKGYELGNLCWATAKEQRNNQRRIG